MPIVNGLLSEAIQKPTEHFNQRPKHAQVSLLMIHNISLPAGHFSGSYVSDLFCGTLDTNSHPTFCDLKGVRVSSHLFIRRNAQVIQFVNFNNRAWHAGVSSFNGVENCNDYSIGIELEGTDNMPFTKRQYVKLTSITKQLMKAYPDINTSSICGHSDVAPGRKTDPGPFFDWARYTEAL